MQDKKQDYSLLNVCSWLYPSRSQVKYKIYRSSILKLIQFSLIRKGLIVSSFWKIVKQSQCSLMRNWIQEHVLTINYEQPIKKVSALYTLFL